MNFGFVVARVLCVSDLKLPRTVALRRQEPRGQVVRRRQPVCDLAGREATVMSTYDNAPPLPDWSVPPTRHCGEWCFDRTCGVCGEYVPKIPENVILGAE